VKGNERFKLLSLGKKVISWQPRKTSRPKKKGDLSGMGGVSDSGGRLLRDRTGICASLQDGVRTRGILQKIRRVGAELLQI